MAKYLTAKQLGILPEERKALIAFCTAPTLGRIVALNGHAHYYDQEVAETEASEHECGTAGCVAGFVLAHARIVQRKHSLRGERNAESYLERAVATDAPEDEWWNEGKPLVPVLYDLYTEDDPRTLSEARSVVAKMLRTGKVKWR